MQINLVVGRRGSKGCPGKAIRPLPDGSCCLDRAVDVALALPGRVVVSVDYSASEWAHRRGHGVLRVKRPADLASDAAPMSAVLEHACAMADCARGDLLVLLQAASPLRTVETVKRCVDAACRSGRTTCTAMPFPAAWHPHYALGYGRALPTRRQDLPPAYRPDGIAYVGTVRDVLRYGYRYLEWIVSPAGESMSIDTEQDWEVVCRRISASKT